MPVVTELKQNKTVQCPLASNQSTHLSEQITSLQSEIASLRHTVMDLRERIGAVRGWIKNALLVFSIFCLLVIAGHYFFLLQLPHLENELGIFIEYLKSIKEMPRLP